GVGASTQQERKPGRASFDVEYRIPRALSPWECQLGVSRFSGRSAITLLVVRSPLKIYHP
ncbi:MAG: hypothetical protein RIM23_08495, partial [Coleofasciculus sp. G3-WIS-01]|uniref:hypothetical protein n=1 Tax=Coleofasciculus sp. G3-WIS-01 TaxID=3069528 RepID=UPI0033026C6A